MSGNRMYLLIQLGEWKFEVFENAKPGPEMLQSIAGSAINKILLSIYKNWSHILNEEGEGGEGGNGFAYFLIN